MLILTFLQAGVGGPQYLSTRTVAAAMGLCLMALKAAYSGTLVASLTGKCRIPLYEKNDPKDALFVVTDFFYIAGNDNYTKKVARKNLCKLRAYSHQAKAKKIKRSIIKYQKISDKHQRKFLSLGLNEP